jgi:hypothetical protein
MKIKELGEFELIEKIKEITETKNYNHSITLPNGDDCFAFKEKGKKFLKHNKGLPPLENLMKIRIQKWNFNKAIKEQYH